MYTAQSSSFLRRVLKIDAVTSGISAALMLLTADEASKWFGLPVSLLAGAGIVLVPFALFVFYVATRPIIARGAVWTVIALNVLWVIDSLLTVFAGWTEPTALGTAVVIAQALGVAVLAELEYLGLKRAPATA
jgi:hypothetical protein